MKKNTSKRKSLALLGALTICVICAICGPVRAQVYPYTHSSLLDLNANTTFPCGQPGTPTQQIITSLANLPITGGTLDMTCYGSPITITADIFSPVSKNVTVFLPPVAVSVAANATIPANFQICSRSGSSLTAALGYTLINNGTSCTTGSTPLTPNLSVAGTNGSGVAVGAIYTASGTGAVARTVTSKLSDLISVTDYGAIGDGGTTDNAPAFSLAQTAAGNTGALFIPLASAAYGINSNLTITSPLLFSGGVLQIASGKTLTINGIILTGGTPIFRGSGSVIVNNQPVLAQWFSGADAGAKISAAIAALPAAGGVVDARAILTGNLSALTYNKPNITVLFNPAAQLLLTGQQIIAAQGVTLHADGFATAMLVNALPYSAGTPSPTMMIVGAGAKNTVVEGFDFTCGTGSVAPQSLGTPCAETGNALAVMGDATHIVGNTIIRYNRFGDTKGIGVNAAGTVLTVNPSSQTGAAGIYLFSTNDTYITENYFFASGFGIVSDNTPSGSATQNNVLNIYDNLDIESCVYDGFAEIHYGSYGGSMIGNHFEGNGRYGINGLWLGEAIEGNYFESDALGDIYAATSSFVASGVGIASNVFTSSIAVPAIAVLCSGCAAPSAGWHIHNNHFSWHGTGTNAKEMDLTLVNSSIMDNDLETMGTSAVTNFIYIEAGSNHLRFAGNGSGLANPDLVTYNINDAVNGLTFGGGQGYKPVDYEMSDWFPYGQTAKFKQYVSGGSFYWIPDSAGRFAVGIGDGSQTPTGYYFQVVPPSATADLYAFLGVAPAGTQSRVYLDLGGNYQTTETTQSRIRACYVPTASTCGTVFAEMDFNNDTSTTPASTGGDVCIKTLVPGGSLTQAMCIDSSQAVRAAAGLVPDAGGSAPNCISTIAGAFWYVQGNSSTKDVVEVCAHDATNTYAWRAIY